MKTDSMDFIVNSVAELKALRNKLDQACKEFLTPGTDVYWKRGKYIQSGTILWCGGADRMKVKNSKTGKEVFISQYDIAWPVMRAVISTRIHKVKHGTKDHR